MAPLDGRVALVTGGSRGIGAAIARRLAADGADVALTYVSAAERAATVTADVERAGRRALALRVDVADPDAVVGAVERTVGELGRLDVLVNNAGVFPYGPIEDVSRDEVDRTVAIHVTAAFLAAQAAARRMGEGGTIVSVGSCLADHAGGPGVALYAMTKAALTGLTRGLARDLGPRGITANVVHPGPVDTDMNPADGVGAQPQREGTAIGRFGEAQEIAATVAFLAGSEARYLTGAAIAVDGGTNA